MFFQSKVYCAKDYIDTFFSLDTIHRWRDKYFRCRPLSCNRIFLQRRSETAFFNCPVFLRLGVFATWWHVVMGCVVTWQYSYVDMRCCGMWCFVVLWCVDHTRWCIAILSPLLMKELQPSSVLAMTKLGGNAPSTTVSQGFQLWYVSSCISYNLWREVLILNF